MSGRAKYTAAVSLGVMGAGFAATLPFTGNPWAAFLHSGFEAGLVGGLADWFAVTALFRHPLGLPIPHTALLPKNRDRVTKAFVSTIENDLLSKESIMNKLTEWRIVSRVLAAAEKQLHSDEVKNALQMISERLVEQIPVEQAVAFAESEIRTKLETLDTRKAIEFVMEQVLAKEYDEKAFDFVLDVAEQFVFRDETRDRLGAMASQAIGQMQTGGFMGFALNAFAGFLNEDKLGSMIQQFILKALMDLRRQGDNNRRAILHAVRGKLQQISEDPELLETIGEWKEKLLGEWNLNEQLHSLAMHLKEKALEWIRSERFAAFVLPLLERMLQKLQEDESLLERMEAYVRAQLARWVEANHHKIGVLIQENVERFDNETLIHLMEDKVGKDLQWIRVNGAICGFLIGLLLEGIRWLV
ncbi:DUF445 domain-containing protein [Paenibacillus silviterrae]|uniref:DUF445 domain-containing protein n=1 Tax=Paenibacillus silviterrae TaxID=3242194 RepID=UPI0025437C9E|nr:DUF445 domain-containing protein [Paenibacillus chinjuensis]